MATSAAAQSGWAIGSVGDVVAVIDNRLPYDCNHGRDTPSALDAKLAEISVGDRALAFFVDGGTGTYGFTEYHEGFRSRSLLVVPGEANQGFGEELPDADCDLETWLLVLFASYAGSSLTELMIENPVELVAYEGNFYDDDDDWS